MCVTDNTIMFRLGDALHRHLGGRGGDGLREAGVRDGYRHQAPAAHGHTAATPLSIHEGMCQFDDVNFAMFLILVCIKRALFHL